MKNSRRKQTEEEKEAVKKSNTQEGFTQFDFNFFARGETCWNGVNYMLRTVNMKK